MKFSTIHHLNYFDRSEIVIDFIDARHDIRTEVETMHVKMTNKRKATGNDELIIEPPPKIIKQEEFPNNRTFDEGLHDSEDIPDLIGPDVKEEEETEGIPELEPKSEALDGKSESKNITERMKEDMKTETEEMNTHEEVNSSEDHIEKLKSEAKSEEISNSEKSGSEDEIEPEEDDFVKSDIPGSFKNDWKTETEIPNEFENESDDDFFVPDEADFEKEKSSGPLSSEEILRRRQQKWQRRMDKWMRNRHKKLLKEWQSEDIKAGFQNVFKNLCNINAT